MSLCCLRQHVCQVFCQVLCQVFCQIFCHNRLGQVIKSGLVIYSIHAIQMVSNNGAKPVCSLSVACQETSQCLSEVHSEACQWPVRAHVGLSVACQRYQWPVKAYQSPVCCPSEPMRACQWHVRAQSMARQGPGKLTG